MPARAVHEAAGLRVDGIKPLRPGQRRRPSADIPIEGDERRDRIGVGRMAGRLTMSTSSGIGPSGGTQRHRIGEGVACSSFSSSRSCCPNSETASPYAGPKSGARAGHAAQVSTSRQWVKYRCRWREAPVRAVGMDRDPAVASEEARGKDAVLERGSGEIAETAPPCAGMARSCCDPRYAVASALWHSPHAPAPTSAEAGRGRAIG